MIYQCKSCGKDFSARIADRKRGWALFCGKSCEATEQARKYGQSSSLKKSAVGPFDAFDADDLNEAAQNFYGDGY